MKQVDNDLVKLLQDIVRIPSWVPSEEKQKKIQNENKLVDYLEEWLVKNTSMQIARQNIPGGRYNLIASRGDPELVFLAHTDTVQPSENAPYDQLAAEIHDGKIWGRGTTDMKSGIATMIQALSLATSVDNVWMFLYADEEYDFLGMKALVKEYGKIKPKLIVSSDGSDLGFGHGCRGLIEFRGRFAGKTGHPARGTGVSATMLGYESLIELQKFTNKFKHPEMGTTSFNVAYFLGGAMLADSINSDNVLEKVGQAGNVVSDVMEFVLDIRPATPDLNYETIVDRLNDISSQKGLDLEIIDKTHSLGAWYTDIKEVEKFVEIAQKSTKKSEIKIDNPGESGYIDLQMLWEATGRPPAFMFGGGNGDTAHTPQEHIDIKDLIKTRDFFIKVLENR